MSYSRQCLIFVVFIDLVSLINWILDAMHFLVLLVLLNDALWKLTDLHIKATKAKGVRAIIGLTLKGSLVTTMIIYTFMQNFGVSILHDLIRIFGSSCSFTKSSVRLMVATFIYSKTIIFHQIVLIEFLAVSFTVFNSCDFNRVYHVHLKRLSIADTSSLNIITFRVPGAENFHLFFFFLHIKMHHINLLVFI